MSTRLDREGLFKAVPVVWDVYEAKSGAVAVNIEFRILEQYDVGSWIDWRGCEEHIVLGAYYVVKKDGTVNTETVRQLVESLGWNGSLKSVVGDPPGVIVQIQVKQDDYEGKTRFNAGWMNPGNFSPRSTMPADDVTKLDTRFGSLLRAAASQTKPQAVTANGDDLPF